MRTVFQVSLIEPIKQDIGVFSNKSIAFDQIEQQLPENAIVAVSEASDKFAKFHNKQMNYINFTKYFKDTKNGTKLILKIMNADANGVESLSKTIICQMFIVNAKV